MRRNRVLHAFASASLLALACGDADGTVRDAGMIDAAVDAGLAITTPPAAPALPVLAPCASGWTEVDDGEIAVCDPYPATRGPMACGVDEAHFPGEPGCVRVGAACPAGDFPDDLPTDRPILYVRAGAGPGGDGTRASPFGRILDASRAATSGTILAIGKGTYDEVVPIGPGVTLWGACVAETVLTSSLASTTDGVLTPIGAGAVVRNLRVSEPARPAIVVDNRGATLALDEVVVGGAHRFGLFLLAGTVTARDIVVRDTRRAAGALSGGIAAEGDVHLVIERGALERNASYGIGVNGPSMRAELRDVVVSGTARSEPLEGRALQVVLGAQADVTRAVFVDNEGTAVFGAVDGSAIVLVDTVVRGRSDVVDGEAQARGIGLEDASTITATRLLVEDTWGSGIYVAGVGARAQTADAVIRRIRPAPDTRDFGRGIEVVRGASAEMLRTAVLHTHDVGVFVAADGATARFEDLSVLDVIEQASDGRFGRGVVVQFGAVAEIVRGRLETFRDSAVFAIGAGTRAQLVDVTARDGVGIVADGMRGSAINAQDGAFVGVERGSFEHLREIGVFAWGEGTSVELRDTSVRDIAARRCFDDGLCVAPAGIGLGAYEHASLIAARFEVRRANLCAVQVALDGSADLHDGTIAESAVGACVGVPGYDLGRLDDGVTYESNASRVQTDALPVPDPAVPSGD